MIKKITLEIGGKEVEVTPEEARQLYNDLGLLFGAKQPIQYIPSYVPNYPQTWWSTVDSIDGTVGIVSGDMSVTTDTVLHTGRQFTYTHNAGLVTGPV